MTYQVLARKWRPRDFSEVVGQAPIVTALSNGLTEGRIAQAYLFSGIRGVGKTTVARVMAKALNCEHGPTASPCNQCVACREISAGADLDVFEVDAATYSKVEQIRDLTEGLKYGPTRDRYKVVVIDEIHRLSRQAFDALLKIVEEPPPHLVFIFATTEVEAVPATILSRCQEFRFRRVPLQILADHLRRICSAESIAAGDAVLRLIARAGEGSVRDAVALLDQLATFGNGSIPDDEASRLLGGLDTDLFLQVLDAVISGEPRTVSEIVRRVEAEGWDPRHVFTQFLAYCREGLHLALGSSPSEVDLPADEASALSALATRAGRETMLRLLHHLLASEQSVRRSEAGSLALEIVWLRAAELPKLTRIEELLAGAPIRPDGEGERQAMRDASADETSAPAPATQQMPARPPRPESHRAATQGQSAATTPAALPSAPTAARPHDRAPNRVDSASQSSPAAAAASGASEPVEAFLQEVRKAKQSLAAHLAEAQRIALHDGKLEIWVRPDDDLLHRALDRATNRELIERLVAAMFGAGTSWEVRRSAAVAPNADPEPVLATDPALQDPLVQSVLDIFQGTVQTVEKIED